MSQELREYITRAKELEAAIYTQQKLMEEHRGILESEKPIKPIKEDITCPIKPQLPEMQEYEGSAKGISTSFIIAAIFWVGSFILFAIEIAGWSMISMMIGAFAALYGLTMAVGRKQNRNTFAKQCDAYKNALKQYEQEKLEFYARQHTIDASYQLALKSYNTKISKFNEKVSLNMERHRQMLQNLTAALEAHYAQNILFPKYRNLVAVSSIEEYLLSGRCATLEGANGAYNLYEMELRQNIVIGQLASVLDNLEQVKNNQYSLYQELNRANEEIREITTELRTVRENTRLTAYFSALNAKIAASPKIVHGHIH